MLHNCLKWNFIQNEKEMIITSVRVLLMSVSETQEGRGLILTVVIGTGVPFALAAVTTLKLYISPKNREKKTPQWGHRQEHDSDRDCNPT